MACIQLMIDAPKKTCYLKTMNKFLSLFYLTLSLSMIVAAFSFSCAFILQGNGDAALWSMLALIPAAPVFHWLSNKSAEKMVAAEYEKFMKEYK